MTTKKGGTSLVPVRALDGKSRAPFTHSPRGESGERSDSPYSTGTQISVLSSAGFTRLGSFQ